MEHSVPIDRAVVADGFREAMAGRMDDQLIDSAAVALAATQTSYKAVGSVMPLIFYMKVKIEVDAGPVIGKTFEGDAGGFAPGTGGGFWGDVYTDDIDRLYKDTVSFAFQATPVYFAVEFFDSSSNCLGSFHGGGIGVLVGVGGGTGRWP